jgi:hypothetical protein
MVSDQIGFARFAETMDFDDKELYMPDPFFGFNSCDGRVNYIMHISDNALSNGVKVYYRVRGILYTDHNIMNRAIEPYLYVPEVKMPKLLS